MTTIERLRALRTRGVGLPACRDHLALLQRIAERQHSRCIAASGAIPERVASGESAVDGRKLTKCCTTAVSGEDRGATAGSLSSFDGCESGCSGPVVVDVPARLCARCAAEMLS